MSLIGSLSNGLVAGLLLAFSVAVLPGLARLSDASYVHAMRAMNQAILNPVFLLLWTAAPILSIGAAVVMRGTAGFPYAVTAGVLACLTFAITAAANIPLNDALASASDLHAAREAFAGPWLRWNAIRTLTSAGACVSLAVAARLG